MMKEGKKRKATNAEEASGHGDGADVPLNLNLGMREHSLSNSHGQTDGRASPSRDENRQRKKNKKKRKREHAMASHDHTSSQDAARELPTNAERESVSGERGAMTQVDNNPGKSFPPPSPVEDSSHVALGHGETKDGANGPGKSATETQKQQQQGDTFSSSPPQERRRLGKTHGRARKAAPGVAPTGSGRSSTGDGGFGRGGGKAGTGLTPDGPGQGTPRKHTLSVAIPGSVVDNAQNRELKTYLVGEIARAAAIFEVDEIVVYDDLSVSRKGQGGVRDDSNAGVGAGGEGGAGGGGDDRNNPNVFMARLLQFVETPQYLRKQLFPMHPTLRLAGLLNPLDAPHHMRADDDCPFREGVVVDRPVKKGAGSFVDVGKRKEARIDRQLATGVRVTVKLDQAHVSPKGSNLYCARVLPAKEILTKAFKHRGLVQNASNRKNYCGRAVAPSAPREELGLYWGYQTRLARGMADVLAGCPYKGGYDLTLGTSERGSTTVDSPSFSLPEYRHVLIVFGGVQGIEATVDSDESLQIPGSESSTLFDMWLNTCPGQGSRTIRTEEAVLITLARLRSHVLANGTQPIASVASNLNAVGGETG